MKSLRLNFKIDSINILLLDIHRTNINAPPSDLNDLDVDYTGYRINLSNEYGILFYSQIIQDPFRNKAEIHAESEIESNIYESLIEPEKTFSILIPNPEKRFILEIINTPYAHINNRKLAVQIFRFIVDPNYVLELEELSSIEDLSFNNGEIIGSTKIRDKGDNSDCWNIAILAEGYQISEMSKFKEDVDNFVDFLIGFEPFNKFKDNINVFRVDISSTDSGADLPSQCNDGDPSINVKTFFNATFCGSNLKRLLVVDQSIVTKVINSTVSDAHVAMVLVNSEIYGGSGGNNAPVFSTERSSSLIGIHELGHSFFNLADEYESPYINDNPDKYPNLTSHTDRTKIKWKHLILDSTPIPTSLNQGCSQSESFVSHNVSEGTVGLFEGGLYKKCNVFRAEHNCLMRDSRYNRFCVVCEEAIRLKLTKFLEIENLVS